jgi:hypothetical protein
MAAVAPRTAVHADVSAALAAKGVVAEFLCDRDIAPMPEHRCVVCASIFLLDGNEYKPSETYVSGLRTIIASLPAGLQLRVYFDRSAERLPNWWDLEAEAESNPSVLLIEFIFPQLSVRGGEAHEGLMGTCVRALAAFDFASCGAVPRLILDTDSPEHALEGLALVPSLERWGYPLFFTDYACYRLRARNSEPYLESVGVHPRVMLNYVWVGAPAPASLFVDFFSCMALHKLRCQAYAEWVSRYSRPEFPPEFRTAGMLFRYGVDEFMMNAYVLRWHIDAGNTVGVFRTPTYKGAFARLPADCSGVPGGRERECERVAAVRRVEGREDTRALAERMRAFGDVFERRLACLAESAEYAADRDAIYEIRLEPGQSTASVRRTARTLPLSYVHAQPLSQPKPRRPGY